MKCDPLNKLRFARVAGTTIRRRNDVSLTSVDGLVTNINARARLDLSVPYWSQRKATGRPHTRFHRNTLSHQVGTVRKVRCFMMKLRKQPQKQVVRIVVVDNDPLRLVGFRALLEPEPDFELTYSSFSDLAHHDYIDIILLNNQRGQNSFDDVVNLRAFCPDAQIIAIGSGMRDETILAALACGAKGYVDEAAPAEEFISAVRAVNRGSVWVSRQLLSIFVDRASRLLGSPPSGTNPSFTMREKEVLEMLVEGRSNREIGKPLGIEVRTVKAHVAKLMRKVGVRNRVALSTYAISHSLLSSAQD
jgi:DNA-binding NarL/FixJ family response regulator